MKNLLNKSGKMLAIALCAMVAACSVDDAYDLSKDIDMTVAVGNGISIPVGSTEAIMLTEMIDPADSDVITVSDDGYYTIEKNGTFDAVDFEIDEVKDLHIDTYIEEQHYDMDLKEMYSSYEEAKNAIANNESLPREIREQLIEELDSNKIAVSLEEAIDKNDIEFDFIKNNLPKELDKLYRVEFEKPVRMHLQVDVKCDTDPALFNLIDSLELSTAGINNKHFYVKVPEYIEFIENENVNGNELYLKGAVHVNESRSQFTMKWDFYINALNFENGYAIKNGSLNLVDKLEINGAVKSNIVMVNTSDIVNGYRTFEDVAFAPTVTIDHFDIKKIVASVNVDIDDITEKVDLELGDDLDFLYEEGTVLDFANPQMIVNINNGADVTVESEVIMRGYDESGNPIKGAEAAASVKIQPTSSNRYFITNTGAEKEGCIAIATNLSSLFKKLPHTIGFELKSKNAANEEVHIELGNSMSVSGDYEVKIPLEFNEVALTYTETIEEILGDDPSEVTDYIKNVDMLTMNFSVANTVPASFTPSVKAYDKNGKELKNINITVEGSIAAGKGMSNGKVTTPVASDFKVIFSAKDNELGELDTIDLELAGKGSGALNTNEYLKIEKMSITIDQPIEVDLN